MGFEPLSYDYDAACCALVVQGSIDELNVHEFRSAVAAASNAADGQLTIDLDAVNFLPSVAIGVLAHAMRRAEQQGRSVALVAGERSVAARILQIAGLPLTTSASDSTSAQVRKKPSNDAR